MQAYKAISVYVSPWWSWERTRGGGRGEIRSALNAHKETSPLFSLSAPNERQACKPFISQYFPSGEKSSWDFLQFLHSGSAFLCNKAPMPPRPQLRTFPPLKYLLLSIKTWVSWECPAFQKVFWKVETATGGKENKSVLSHTSHCS